MTLLHQAAQKAVEALKLTISARTAPNEWDLGVFETAIEKCEVVLRQVESALQQQPEPEAPIGWLYDWTHSSALGKPDEQFTGFTTDEAHARKHDSPRAVYAAPPALQHQEVPREPVAWRYRYSPKQDWKLTSQPTTQWAADHSGFEEEPLYAPPSTTRQQEVGSGAQYRHKRTGGLYAVIGTAKLQTDKPLFDMAEVVAYRGEDGRVWVRAAAEFDERFERAAAPSTPENADGGPHG